MSKYTTEVRFICENKSGLDVSKGSNDVDSIIANSWNKIFTTKVSFFDEEYRRVLCQKILKHYYLREIGCETVGVWTLWMNTRLEEIMPYYNQLYKSALIDFNPLHDTDLTRSHKLNVEGSKEENGTRNDVSKEDTKGNETSETTTTGNATRNLKGSRNTDVTSNETKTTSTSTDSTKRDLYSDTPQGAITGLENENYLTNARKVTDSASEKGSEQTNGTEKTVVNYGEDETNKTGTSSKTTTNTTGTTNETLDSTTSNKGTSNTTEDYIETVIGKQSGMTFSKMLIEFRETFLNIDLQVINEFSDLFFGLW